MSLFFTAYFWFYLGSTGAWRVITDPRSEGVVHALFSFLPDQRVAHLDVWLTRHWSQALRGLGCIVIAGIAFYIGLNDIDDPYRLWHGLSQIFAGVALYFLWQTVPSNNYKKTDERLPLRNVPPIPHLQL